MNNLIVQNTLHDLNIPAFIKRADNATLARMIASVQSADTLQPTPEKLPRYGLIYEKQGIKAYKLFLISQHNTNAEEINTYFQNAYICWRALAHLPNSPKEPLNGQVSLRGIHFMAQAFQEEPLPAELILAFRLSVAGLLGGHIAETRLDLKRFSLSWQQNMDMNWPGRVAENIFTAFTRLVRKDNGWEDIQQALQSIATLKQLQKQYEETYLEDLKDPEQQTQAALTLLGFYHLAQLVILVGEYLQSGQPSYDRVRLHLNGHYDQAIESLEQAQQPLLLHLADLLWAGCRELVHNAIWTHAGRISEPIRQYVQFLTSTTRQQPVIELWPSQQEAFRQHLLDAYQRAILVEMPTSAGKTLLAKFAIIQTKALNPHSLVTYIVPTRALVNQVTLDLRLDFHGLLRVEQAVPAFELDPMEEHLLKSHIDVLVTTPEKLDLLVKSEHSIVKDISLVIADEAHNICDGTRGARLELLLGTIKRDFANARFLLLSPFVPNPQDLIRWLGEDQILPPITIDWQPNRKLVGVVESSKAQNQWSLVFETFDSAHSVDTQAGMEITIGKTPTRLTSIHALTEATVQAMVQRGSILILCKGRSTAARRAKQIATVRPVIASNRLVDAVCHYVEAEISIDCDLALCIRHGVAYHHSGLSHEIRWLIEALIRAGLVTVVCATTTLTQGINFPISTVIIETLEKGNAKLSFQDFWNIAGRAGRTLVDTLGVVVFPAPTQAKQDELRTFFKHDAQQIASQLADLIEQADKISSAFNLQSLRDNPQLSPLLQFLAHAMRVSGNENLANEVEELLQASLFYHQMQQHGQEAIRQLVKICRTYLEQTREHKNILQLADRTGFATPSVLELLAQKKQNQELAQAENWLPERLFGDNLEPLIERIKIIADLPEIKLGEDDGAIFNVRNFALILRAWVNGETLENMARLYSKPDSGQGKQIADFSKYLFSTLSRASWGMGALETVCLAGNEQVNWQKVGYVPSMIFFGVRQEEAILLRMVGIPRIFATPLARIWQQRVTTKPDNYDTVRAWIDTLSDADWQQIIPPNTSLTHEDMRIIWHSFSGTTHT